MAKTPKKPIITTPDPSYYTKRKANKLQKEQTYQLLNKIVASTKKKKK